MTAVQDRVAADVPFAGLCELAEGTAVLWNGAAASHGTLFSPLGSETAPDVIALHEPRSGTVEVLQLHQNRSYTRLTALPHTPGASAAAVLRAAAALVDEDVLRFATGRELDAAATREVPAVALWTGPGVPAWRIPVLGSRPDLRGSRVVWADTLSHRVPDSGQEPVSGRQWTRLVATQHADDVWTLSVGDRVAARLHEHAEHHTLEQVLVWMNASLHTTYESAPFQQMVGRPFEVTDPDGTGPLTVRMW